MGGNHKMEFRQLKTFVATVKYSNFTKAADHLGYAQSTITGHIQALEEELDTMLFERIGKQVKLTREGEHFHSYAEQLLALSSEALDFISSSDIPKGSIVVGTPESLCLHHLSDIFRDFRVRCPKVEINLDFGSYNDFRLQLRKNTIDIAFFLDRPCTENDLITHVLYEEQMAVIAAPTHPLARQRQVTPRDMNDQPLVLTEAGCTYRRIFESILTQTGVKPASTLAVGSNEVIKKFVSDGWGIGFLPYVTVRQEVEQGQITALPWAGPSFDIYAQVLYHKEKWFSPALRAFFELALERLQDTGVSLKAK
jgi:DNA-binding transcriptional LysR family regulator